MNLQYACMRKFIATVFLSLALLLFPALETAALMAAPAEDDDIRVIVIDPGHGGEDTGARGASGVEEKDITLKLAFRIAEALKGRLDCRVLLTRTSDAFVPLSERTAFANRNKADLFISIHANAASNRDARGIETFFLSFEATDEGARRVAAFENSANSAAAPRAVQEADEDLRAIFLDLANTRSHHESSRLAEAVHASMLGGTGREGRGVKQAPFTVLVGATMPAILVEAGFISNPAEETWLSSARDQATIAEAIADGVLSFREIMTGKRGYIEVSGKTEQD